MQETARIVAVRVRWLRWRFAAIDDRTSHAIAMTDVFASSVFAPSPRLREREWLDALVTDMAAAGWSVQPRPATLERDAPWFDVRFTRPAPSNR